MKRKRNENLKVACISALLLCNLVGYAASAIEDENLADKVFNKAKEVFDGADTVHYEHRHQGAKGQVTVEGNSKLDATTDCSGFVSYVVHAVAPGHYQVIHELEPGMPYPQAQVYAQFFQTLSPAEPHQGWLRIDDYRQLRRGDFIAWVKGATAENHSGHGNTGHVMIVVDPVGTVHEQEVAGEKVRYISVNVIDSSSVYHFPPEELPPLAHQDHRDGVGIGHVRIILSEKINRLDIGKELIGAKDISK